MQFAVPQHVDIEDKIAFRLNIKQLGWFGLGGFVLFATWMIFEKWVFWVSFPFIVGAAALFAFYKPAGLTLIEFLFDGVKYLIKPKEMTWKKEDDILMADKYGKRDLDTTQEDYNRTIKNKEKQISEIDSLAKILDEKSDL
jgi:hypothetical protein